MGTKQRLIHRPKKANRLSELLTDRAVLAVPAFVADAGAVGAEAVGVAAMVALQLVAQGSRPPGVAHASLAAAVTVHALQPTHLCKVGHSTCNMPSVFWTRWQNGGYRKSSKDSL